MEGTSHLSILRPVSGKKGKGGEGQSDTSISAIFSNSSSLK